MRGAHRNDSSIEAPQEVRHLERRERSVRTLVARLAARAIDRLLDGVGGQYAEADGHARFERDARESGSTLAGDIIEMRRLAANDRTEGDQGLVAPRLRQLARDDRNVEGARHAYDLDLLLRRPVALQRIHRTAYQRLDDEIVESRHDQGEAQIAHDEIALGHLELLVRHAAILARLFAAIHVLGHFEVEGRQTLELLRRAQHPHALQPQVLQYLRADAIGAQHRGARVSRSGRLRIDLTHAVHELPRRLLGAQDDHHARALGRDAAHRRAQRPTEILAAHSDQIAQRVLDVHTHQGRHPGIEVALHQGDVHVAMHLVLVAAQLEPAELGLDRLVVDALDRALVLQAIADEIGDGADLERMCRREPLEIGTARHGAVVVQYLDDRGGGRESREAREIAPRFGVAGASEHAAGLRHERKDMSGLAQILGARLGRYGCLDRMRAVVRRYSRRHTLGRLDGQREVG